jgi:hypothetical protein
MVVDIPYTEDNTNTYNVLAAKHEGKRPVKRPSCRCEYNIKTDLKAVRLRDVD